MRIVIAGGSGFLGRALSRRLAADGHQVDVLTRRPAAAGAAAGATPVEWHPDGQAGPWARHVDGAAAVVNLAGESIAARRWSPAQKQILRDSRIRATRSLAAAIGQAAAPPVLVSGSAVGYYGDRGDETLTESSPPGHDFLADLARDWEQAAAAAADRTRVATIRTGIVLDRRGGALARMLPPFRLFAGGPIGSGRQYMPWIHLDDWVRLVVWAIGDDRAQGPLNAASPRPVTNREFSRALGAAIGRPSLLPAPRFALRLALGEMADALLLSSQRVLPARAAELGFSFRYESVDDAFAEIFR